MTSLSRITRRFTFGLSIGALAAASLNVVQLIQNLMVPVNLMEIIDTYKLH